MSAVKIKNAAVKAAATALQGHFGRPVAVSGKLASGRLSLYIGAIGRPVYLPSCYSFHDGGATIFSFQLFGKEYRTAEALDAITVAKQSAAAAIQAAGASGVPYVGFENDADNEHAAALKAHWQATGEQPAGSK
jgi:hypothetical protein